MSLRLTFSPIFVHGYRVKSLLRQSDSGKSTSLIFRIDLTEQKSQQCKRGVSLHPFTVFHVGLLLLRHEA